MKIRIKCILAIIISTFMIFIALHLAAAFILHPSYTQIETREMKKSLSQLNSALKYQLDTLGASAKDYSSWDDTYRYVQDKNQYYVNSNFVDPTFANLKLNIIAIVDNNKSLLFYKSFDLNNSISVEPSKDLQNFLQTESAVWNFSSTNASVSGLILIDNQPMMVTARPILTSNNQGPIIGGLLFGRYLDSIEISKLQQITNLNFTIQPLSSINQETALIAKNLLSTDQSIVKENNINTVSSYQLIKDIHSEPLFIVTINENREVNQQGDMTEYIFISASAALTITLAIVLLVMMDKFIFKPMTRIATSIETAPYEKSNIKSDHGVDEISIVEDSVRTMVNKKMEAMNKVSTMVAHDLRNPLQGIRGATYLLKKDLHAKLSEKNLEMFKTIDNCLEYSNKIVSDLLDYSTNERLDLKLTDINSLMDEVLSTVFIPQGIKIVNSRNSDCKLLIDKLKILRAFNNLIKNAFDAMPNGGELHIERKIHKEYVQIHFSDTGIGMSKQVIENIWVPFFTTKARGMGVGLPTCKRIIEAHGGEIKVESTERKGTTFTIFLPITT